MCKVALCYLLLVSSVQGQLSFPGGNPNSVNPNECTTPDDREGLCTELSRCIPLLNLLKIRPVRPEVIRHLRQSICKFVGKRPHVCCPELKPFKPPETTTTTEPEEPVTLPDVDVCGIGGDHCTDCNKIVGGTPAKLHSWPWIAALGFRVS